MKFSKYQFLFIVILFLTLAIFNWKYRHVENFENNGIEKQDPTPATRPFTFSNAPGAALSFTLNTKGNLWENKYHMGVYNYDLSGDSIILRRNKSMKYDIIHVKDLYLYFTFKKTPLPSIFFSLGSEGRLKEHQEIPGVLFDLSGTSLICKKSIHDSIVINTTYDVKF